MSIVDRALSKFCDTKPAPTQRRISLALQGGGSFGAFTWGVLDRLLEEDDLEFDTISGASAGAVNASLLAAGLVDGGRDEARARLERFWRRIAASGGVMRFAGNIGFDFVTSVMAPHHFNPLNLDPLRAALEDEIDFAQISDEASVRLLVATTRVSDGQSRIFRNADLSIEAVLASACIPRLQRSVMIDGEAYWDGGYALNPPLTALVHESLSDHILVVQLTPTRIGNVPRTQAEISKRLDQIMLNSSLNSQVEALQLNVQKDVRRNRRALQIDTIAAENEVDNLVARSATSVDGEFVEMMRDAGRNGASRWLEQLG